MKKIIISLSLVLTFGFSIQTADAFTSKYASFWENLFGKYSSHFSLQKTIKQTSNITENQISRDFIHLRKNWRKIKLSKYSNSPSLIATITSTTPSQDIYKITETPINIFKIGIRNNTKKYSSVSPISTFLDKAEFSLFSQNGIFKNPRNFSLVVNNEEFKFSENGKVTIKFNNARLAASESMELDIAIKADDPSQMEHTNGTAKLRLLNITAYQEISRDSVPVRISGNRISKRITYNPTPVISNGGNSTIVSTSNSSIYGDLILAGDEKFVLATEFNASYDDLAIRKITIRNNLTGNLIDSQIQEIRAINLLTGELLQTSKFTNGEARFLFSPRINIGRGDSVKLGFKVAVKENPRNNGDRRFKLELFPSDVVVESLSTGRELPNGNKHFNVNSETFMVVKSELTTSPVNNQPNNILIGTGNPERSYEFKISNNSRDSASLGRISLNIYPNGLVFNGGSISPDDFELVEIYGNHEENLNTIISTDGNKVTFDFNNELTIHQNSAKKLRLKIALNELGASDNNDGISVRLLGDSNYQNNTLAGVRGTGANFIWSDESAHSHSENSNDWFSGYHLKIPSNSVFVKR